MARFTVHVREYSLSWPEQVKEFVAHDLSQVNPLKSK
jgi:hypothetical protein